MTNFLEATHILGEDLERTPYDFHQIKKYSYWVSYTENKDGTITSTRTTRIGRPYEEVLRENLEMGGEGLEIVCGMETGVSMIDIDTDNPLEIQGILSCAGLTMEELPVLRRGKKGFAFPVQAIEGSTLQFQGIVDVLTNSSVCSIPPGEHRKGGRYECWVNKQLYPECKDFFDVLSKVELPKVSDNFIAQLTSKYGSAKVPAKGRYIEKASKKGVAIKGKALTDTWQHFNLTEDTFSITDLESAKAFFQSHRKSGHLLSVDTLSPFGDTEKPLEKFKDNVGKIHHILNSEAMTHGSSCPIFTSDVITAISKCLVQLFDERKDLVHSYIRILRKAFPGLKTDVSDLYDTYNLHATLKDRTLSARSDFDYFQEFAQLLSQRSSVAPRVHGGSMYTWNGDIWAPRKLTSLENDFLYTYNNCKKAQTLCSAKSLIGHIVKTFALRDESLFFNTKGVVVSDGVQYRLDMGKKPCELRIEEPEASNLCSFELPFKIDHDYLNISFEESMAYLEEKAPRFREFLKTVFENPESIYYNDKENVLKSIQEVFGAVLFGLGNRISKAVLFLGAGRSGKSTLIEVIKAILPTAFTTSVSPFNWQKDPFSLASLENKMLNAVTELPKEGRLPDAIFKAIIACEPISVNKKYGEYIGSTRFSCMHLFASNYPPRSADTENGFRRRWWIFCFPKAISEANVISDLKQQIVDLEANEIVTWAVTGAVRLARNNFTPTKTLMSEEGVSQIMGTNDFLFDYLSAVQLGADDTLKISPDLSMEVSEFFKVYAQKCKNPKALTTNTAITSIADRGEYFGIKVVGSRIFGIGFREEF